MFSSLLRRSAFGYPPLPPAANKPVVCYVTDRKALGSNNAIRSMTERIRLAAVAGVDWVQIREKDLGAKELLALTKHAVACGTAKVIVNDRLDVALAAGAAGAHLGRGSAPVAEVVRWCRAGNARADFLIGVSCHSLEDACEAEAAGAAYVFFGPVFETPSKRPFGPPQGIASLAEVCRQVRIPVIAIGGIDEKNATDCIRSGAAGIAAIRLFQENADAEELRDMVKRLHGVGQ
jgi:thiamine-phosphate pyrophosphorylase